MLPLTDQVDEARWHSWYSACTDVGPSYDRNDLRPVSDDGGCWSQGKRKESFTVAELKAFGLQPEGGMEFVAPPRLTFASRRRYVTIEL